MQRYALAIHGGAGAITIADGREADARHEALRTVLEAGRSLLARGGTAVDAVALAVSLLEDCPLFNAGRGAVLNADAEHELEASIMDGATGGAAGLIGVRRIRNPVLGARALMQAGHAVLLFGAAAERFAIAAGLEVVDVTWFTTPERVAQLRRAQALSQGAVLDHDAATLAARDDEDMACGTVGAVACDARGNLAAATSTGGLTNKPAGRIGDSPIIGAGCYADNRSVAVSATGTGEHLLRIVAAHAVAARVEYGGASVQQAAERVVNERLARSGGRGGLIAIDSHGQIAFAFNTAGMYRGWVSAGQAAQTFILG
ncbi:MAG TPA: isoaspartyl peptidase/L-asparaginase [Rhodocyclaceae bacterium]|nr:isoaspartyl peptidase/L-asparaginase [Rhodocyclaceae bacterium]